MNTKMEQAIIGPDLRLKKTPVYVYFFRVVLIISVIVWLYPIIFSFLTSFKTIREFYSNVWAFPKNIGIANYISAIIKGQIGEYFINSVIIAIGSLLLIETFSVMAAYSLARLRIPYAELIIVFCFFIQLLPTETLIIPLYLTMSKLNLLEKIYIPIILVYAGWSIPGTTVILKNFFDTIPAELLDAARIDGANEFATMFKIVLPLMKSALATCIVMNFTFVWGELMWAQTATLTTEKGIPLTVGLLNFKGQYGTDWPLLCAAICVIIIPMYLLFIFLQKYFVASLTAGSVKG